MSRARRARGRFRVAIAALRGQSIIANVTITDGIVHLRGATIAFDADILNCTIWTPGPARVLVRKGSIWRDNTGDALDYPGGVTYE